MEFQTLKWSKEDRKEKQKRKIGNNQKTNNKNGRHKPRHISNTLLNVNRFFWNFSGDGYTTP